MTPSFLEAEQLKLLVFCGKGGVGKTTIACASGLELASRFPHQAILLLSTDPAHSLSDSLDQPIGDSLTSVQGFTNLSALELDAASRLQAFRRRYHKELETLLDRGTLLDEQDSQDLLRQSLAGLDELAALIEVARIAKSGQYDHVILDTAPTGHLLRLLELPAVMQGWLKTALTMQEKYRYMVARLTRRSVKDSVDEMLRHLAADVNGVRSLFRNAETTGFVLVTVPEPMAVEETKRLFDRLRQLRLSVRSLVVNRVVSRHDCTLCEGRAAGQAQMLTHIEQLFADVERLRVALFPVEVRGRQRLLELARNMATGGLDEPAAEGRDASGSGGIPRLLRPRQQGRLSGLDDLELLLFGGKGGVGKTTMAAATAVALSQRDGKRTLLFSTDPAHSLSDCFGRAIGNRLTALSDDERLVGLEIDPTQLFDELKSQFSEAVAEAFGSRDVDLPFERAITEGLIQTTPPGIDELLAILKVVEFMQQGTFERYVLDLAPTGHALRFLESFDLLNAWRASASKLVVRYGIAANRPLAILVERLRHLRTVRELLRDPTRCQFVAVAVPEAMVVSELKRLLERLQALGICVRHLILNMVVPENGCPFCQARRHEQQRLSGEFSALKLNLVHVPLFAHHPVGLKPLHELAYRLFLSKEKKEVAAELEPACDLAQSDVQNRTESRQGSWVSRILHLLN